MAMSRNYAQSKAKETLPAAARALFLRISKFVYLFNSSMPASRAFIFLSESPTFPFRWISYDFLFALSKYQIPENLHESSFVYFTSLTSVCKCVSVCEVFCVNASICNNNKGCRLTEEKWQAWCARRLLASDLHQLTSSLLFPTLASLPCARLQLVLSQHHSTTYMQLWTIDAQIAEKVNNLKSYNKYIAGTILLNKRFFMISIKIDGKEN